MAHIDMGKPRRIKFSNTMNFDMGKDKAGDDSVPTGIYSDIEASGGLQGDMTSKSRADSPPMI
jgi:hypothetical protein